VAETKTMCKNGIEHRFEYHKTEEGNSYYVCWVCGDVQWVAEDAGHGG
jgi:hypothetical protein